MTVRGYRPARHQRPFLEMNAKASVSVPAASNKGRQGDCQRETIIDKPKRRKNLTENIDGTRQPQRLEKPAKMVVRARTGGDVTPSLSTRQLLLTLLAPPYPSSMMSLFNGGYLSNTLIGTSVQARRDAYGKSEDDISVGHYQYRLIRPTEPFVNAITENYHRPPPMNRFFPTAGGTLP